MENNYMKISINTNRLIILTKKNILQLKIAIIPIWLLLLFFSTTVTTMAAELVPPTNLRIVSDTPPPQPLPPSKPGNHTHFETESAKRNVILARSYRSEQEIEDDSQFTPNNMVNYDAKMDAAKIIIPSGVSNLSPQLRPTFGGNYLTMDGDELWLQWEARFDSSYAPAANLNGIETNKLYQLASGSGKQKFEFRHRYSFTDDTAVAVPDYRVYQNAPTEFGIQDIREDGEWCSPLSYNVQPGGETWGYGRGKNLQSASDHLADLGGVCSDQKDNFFLIRPDTWIRYSVKWTRTSGVERVTIWMADETTGPVVVLQDTDGVKGFKVDYSDANGFDRFWVEYNTSQKRSAGADLVSYFRNFIVSTSEIALGGRPVP